MAYTTIDDSTAHFQVTTYTGTGSNQTITNDGNSDLQPDLVWFKNREGGGFNHYWYNSTTGVGKNLRCDISDAEGVDSAQILAFNSDGFNLKNSGATNGSGVEFVAWQLKANGGTTSADNEGTTSSVVQANTTAGFSIVKYDGNSSPKTVGHSLGAVPELIIIKNRGSAYSWHCYWGDLGNQGLNWLEVDNNASTNSATWNSTSPTSLLWSMNGGSSYNGVNNGSESYIAFCFRSIQGFSKIGKFKGNGSVKGPFVYTGFRPAFVMTKKVSGSGTGKWMIRDDERDFNGQWRDLYADTGEGETSPDSNTQSDLLSNGFKHRMSHAAHNESGGQYVYVAFAKNPFVTSTGIPSTAV